jgi:hypothetical protein
LDWKVLGHPTVINSFQSFLERSPIETLSLLRSIRLCSKWFSPIAPNGSHQILELLEHPTKSSLIQNIGGTLQTFIEKHWRLNATFNTFHIDFLNHELLILPPV